MKNNRLPDIVGEIDEKYILEAAPVSIKSQKNRSFMKWGTIAACLVLVITIGFGAFAVAAEAKEYKAAVQFFEYYGISKDGLSRGEIKEVYRDITTKSFTYSKTAEVIKNSIPVDRITGYEIEQENPTPEDIENLWNYKNHNEKFAGIEQDGIHYKCRSEYKMDSSLGFEVHDKSYIEKYDGNTLLWSTSVSEFWIEDYQTVSDGVIAYGQTDTWSSAQDSFAWLVKVDSNGKQIWKSKLNNGFKYEYIAEIVENGDGSYAVFSRGDLKYFCLNEYSSDGKQLHVSKTEVGNCGIWNAARFGDGYIVQLGSEHDEIVKVDRDGKITDSFSYGSEDSYYYVTDMMEYNGKIYLSAYAVPRLADEEQNAGGRYDIAAVLNYLDDNNIMEISSEKLTPLVRDNYTAMLMVCDPSSGTPQEFYSVKGSIGGKLSQSDKGELLWDVESITTTFFSPMTSSFSIGGTSYVFRYTFADSGLLISQKKTGEITDFRR